MKRFHTNVGSTKRTLQQGPEILQAVSVYAAIYISEGVVNYLVREFTFQTLVGSEGISEQLSTSFNVCPYSAMKSFLFAIRDDLGANLPATFQDSHDHDLVIGISALSGDAASLYALVHVPRFTADESLVRFNFAS